MKQYNYGVYENDPLLFTELNLTDNQKYELIQTMEILYGNTDQDTEDYAFELVIIIRHLFCGQMILNPKHLILDEALNEIKEQMSRQQWEQFKLDYCKLIEKKRKIMQDSNDTTEHIRIRQDGIQELLLRNFRYYQWHEKNIPCSDVDDIRGVTEYYKYLTEELTLKPFLTQYRFYSPEILQKALQEQAEG